MLLDFYLSGSRQRENPARRSQPLWHRGRPGGVFCWLAAVLLIGPCCFYQGAKAATAELDNDEIYFGETVRLALIAAGDWERQELDLKPLERDFEILGVSSQTRLLPEDNTVVTRTRWAVILQPKRSGSLAIPPLLAGAGRTPPLTLEVMAQSVTAVMEQAGIVIDTELTPPRPYVQAQILYTVRVWHPGDLSRHELIAPAPGPSLSLQALGEARSYRSQREGATLDAIEQRYALFAAKSGVFSLPAFTFRTNLLDSHAGKTGRSKTRRFNIAVAPITLDVQARPQSYGGRHWLPSRDLRLSLEWPGMAPKLRVGEWVRARLVLEAAGLRGFQLPALEWPQQAGWRIYPGAAETDTFSTPNGYRVRRVQPITLVPTRAGELQLPALQLTWWDTVADTAREARLPARTISVAASGDAGRDDANDANDTNDAKNATRAGTGSHGFSAALLYWPLLSAMLGVLWLATVWAWRQERRFAPDRGHQALPAAAKSAGRLLSKF